MWRLDFKCSCCKVSLNSKESYNNVCFVLDIKDMYYLTRELMALPGLMHACTFDIKPNTKQAKVLSTSKLTQATPNATVSGVVTSLSPIHPSRYFDGEITDGECMMENA